MNLLQIMSIMSFLARSLTSLLIALLVLFSISASADAQQRKVLIIGVDGLMPEAVGLPEMSNINSLYQDGKGVLTYGYTEDMTFSGPSWSAILHGVHRDRHGVDSNQYHGHDFTGYPHILMRLKAHNPDLYTAAFVTWSLLQNNFTDTDGNPVGVDELVYHPRQEAGDAMVTDDLVELLETGNPGAVFYYQNDIDGAGHSYGFSIDKPEYREQLRITDSRIGRVLDALKNRREVLSGQEEWLIVLVTDHGGVGTGHSGNLYRQRFIPMILSKTEAHRWIKPEVRIRNVDVSRTVLTYMGVAESEFYELDGHNILERDAYRIPKAGFGKNLLINGDGESDRGFLDRELDQAITGWRSQEHTGNKDGYHSMTLIITPPEVEYTGAENLTENVQSSNLFTGGSKGMTSKMTQIVELDDYQSEIDARCVNFHLSAYLGGTGSREDRMEIRAAFLDKNGDIIDSALLPAVTREDRKSETVLIYRETDGFVSPGTRSVLIELNAIGTTENEGIYSLADQLSFKLNCDRERN